MSYDKSTTYPDQKQKFTKPGQHRRLPTMELTCNPKALEPNPNTNSNSLSPGLKQNSRNTQRNLNTKPGHQQQQQQNFEELTPPHLIFE